MFTRKSPALLLAALLPILGLSLVAPPTGDGMAILITTTNAETGQAQFFPVETEIKIDGLDGQYATVIDHPQGPDEYRGTFVMTLQLPEDARTVKIPVVNGKVLLFEQAASAQNYLRNSQNHFQAQNSGQ